MATPYDMTDDIFMQIFEPNRLRLLLLSFEHEYFIRMIKVDGYYWLCFGDIAKWCTAAISIQISVLMVIPRRFHKADGRKHLL